MNGRSKGHNFERKVADLIRKAFKVPATECYRTPLSGGHPYADRGDLVLGPEMLKRFPFVVECKHTKAWRVEHLFRTPKLMEAWAGQVLKATKDTTNRKSLLIFRGNGTPIFAATITEPNVINKAPVCFIRLQNQHWKVERLEDFLRRESSSRRPTFYLNKQHTFSKLRA